MRQRTTIRVSFWDNPEINQRAMMTVSVSIEVDVDRLSLKALTAIM
jgi:hypothetical protein